MGIPLVALNARQPDIAGSYGKAMQLRQMADTAKLAPLQMQQAQQNVQQGQQSIESNALSLEQQKKTIAENDAITKLFQDAGDDLGPAVKKAMGINPKLAIEYQKSILESQDADVKRKSSLLKYHADQQGDLARIAGGVKTPEDFNKAIGQALAAGDLTPQAAGQLLSQGYSPQLIDQITNQALTAQEKIAQQNAQIQQSAQEQTRLETERHNKETEANAAAGHDETMRHNKTQESIGAGIGNSLNAAALDQAADRYAQTGVLPAMGMGTAGAAVRRQIMNRAGELHPAGSIAANSSEYKANTGSLEALQKNFDQVTAFENTAGKNLDQFLATANKIVDSGAPWVNKPLRAIAQGGLGSADLAAYNAARTTALTEIAKVLNSSNASGVLSDSARSEVSGLIGNDATLKQIVSAADILKKDMQNRRTSYQEQIADIKGRLGGAAQGGGGPASNAAPAKTLSMAAIQQAAKDHGVSIDEAKKQAQAAGYAIQ